MTAGLLQNFGTLHLPETVHEEVFGSAVWAADPWNKVMLTLSVLSAIAVFNSIVQLMPSLLNCVPVARSNISIEHSLRSLNMRNRIFAASLIVSATIFNYFFGYPYPLFVCCAAGFLLLRLLLSLLLPYRMRGNENGRAVRRCIFNFYILFTFILCILTVIFLIFKMPSRAIGIVILAFAALLYMISFIRTAQILSSNCDGFSTFLYLCCLEIIPVGALAASIVIFG